MSKSRGRFPFAAFGKRLSCGCGCLGRCTYDAIWHVMAWCLDVSRTGTYPTVRDDGVPFEYSPYKADRLRAHWGKVKRKVLALAGCIQKRADWQWMKVVGGLAGWRGEGVEGRCCYVCPANTTTMPFTDMTRGAQWCGKNYSHQQYLPPLTGRTRTRKHPPQKKGTSSGFFEAFGYPFG